MKPRITLVETVHPVPSGRKFIEIVPVFKPDCCAVGELRFAVWQVWQDQPDTHEGARAAALLSAHRVLKLFAAEVEFTTEHPLILAEQHP